MKMGQGDIPDPPAGARVAQPVDLADTDQHRQEEYEPFAAMQSEASPDAPSAPSDPENAAQEPTSGQEGPAAHDEGQSFGDIASQLAEDEILEAEAPTPIDVELEDRQHFLRCLLAGDQYKKRFEMFGGQVIAELIDRPVAATDAIFNQLTSDTRQKLIHTEEDWTTTLEQYQLLTSIVHLEIGGKQAGKMASEHVGALRDSWDVFLKTMPGTTVYRALMQLGRDWENHLDELKRRALDSDFWIADGPHSPSDPISEGSDSIAETSGEETPTSSPASE